MFESYAMVRRPPLVGVVGAGKPPFRKSASDPAAAAVLAPPAVAAGVELELELEEPPPPHAATTTATAAIISAGTTRLFVIRPPQRRWFGLVPGNFVVIRPGRRAGRVRLAGCRRAG